MQRPRMSLLKVSLALIPFTLASCTTPSTEVELSNLKEKAGYKLLQADQGRPLEKGNIVEQNGRFQVAVRDRAPHDISFQVRRTIVRGPDDLVLEVADTVHSADGSSHTSTSTFSWNDESASLLIQTPTNVLSTLVINPDESVTINGSTLPSANAAGRHLIDKGLLQGVSPEAAAAVLEVVEGIAADSSMNGSEASRTGLEVIMYTAIAMIVLVCIAQCGE